MLKTQQHQVESKQMKILTRSHVNMYSEIETSLCGIEFLLTLILNIIIKTSPGQPRARGLYNISMTLLCSSNDVKYIFYGNCTFSIHKHPLKRILFLYETSTMQCTWMEQNVLLSFIPRESFIVIEILPAACRIC